MPDKPGNPKQEPFDDADDDFESPPEPEQIWPPPETPRPRKPRLPDEEETGEFARDPELAWEDETEKLDKAINEIRNLEDTGEEDQVQTESNDDIREQMDVDEEEEATIPAPSDEKAVGSMVAGKAPPVVFKAVPPPSQTRGTTGGASAGPRLSPGARRVNDAAEGELAQLWNNVFFSGDRTAPKAVAITAARQGDGATQVATSLALIGAESNHELKIGLIDLNFRHPGVAELLRVRGEPGITDVLEGRATLDQAVLPVTLAGGRTLHVLTTGRIPAHPLSMVKSRQMQSLLSQIRERFDHSIFDVASSDAYPDAQVIGSQLDGALLVVSGGSTPRETVAEAKKRLDLARVRCLGLVLNQRTDPIPDMLYRIA